jgi:hypothetical protein
LERTGVLKGFMIFLIATDAPVSWSFAELKKACVGDQEDAARRRTILARMHLERVNGVWRKD